MVDRVVRRMLADIASESLRINDLAKSKANSIIASALKSQRGYYNPEANVKEVIDKMQDA